MGLGFSFFAKDDGLIAATDLTRSRVELLRAAFDGIGFSANKGFGQANRMVGQLDEGLEGVNKRLDKLDLKARYNNIVSSLHALMDVPGRLGALTDTVTDYVTSLGAIGRATAAWEELALTLDHTAMQMEGGLAATVEQTELLKAAIREASETTGVQGRTTTELATSLTHVGFTLEQLLQKENDVLHLGAAMHRLLGTSVEDAATFLAAGDALGMTAHEMEGLLGVGVQLQKKFKVGGLIQELPGLFTETRKNLMQLGSGFEQQADEITAATARIALAIRRNMRGSMKDAMEVAKSFQKSLIDASQKIRDAMIGEGDYEQTLKLRRLLAMGGVDQGAIRGMLENAPDNMPQIAEAVATAYQRAMQSGNRRRRYQVENFIRESFGPEVLAALDGGGGPEAFIAAMRGAQEEGGEDPLKTFRKFHDRVMNSVMSLTDMLGVTQEFAGAMLFTREGLDAARDGIKLVTRGFRNFGDYLKGPLKKLTDLALLRLGKAGLIGVFGRLKEDVTAFLAATPEGQRVLAFLGKLSDFVGPAGTLVVGFGILGALLGAVGFRFGFLSLTMAPAIHGLGAVGALLGGVSSVAGGLTGALIGLTGAIAGAGVAALALVVRFLLLRALIRSMVPAAAEGGASMGFFGFMLKRVMLPLLIVMSALSGLKTMLIEVAKVYFDPTLVGPERTRAFVAAVGKGLWAALNSLLFGIPQKIYEVFTDSRAREQFLKTGVEWAKAIGKGIGMILVGGAALLVAGFVVALAAGLLALTAPLWAPILSILGMFGLLPQGMQELFDAAFDGIFLGAQALFHGLVEGAMTALGYLVELIFDVDLNIETLQLRMQLLLLHFKKYVHQLLSPIYNAVSAVVKFIQTLWDALTTFLGAAVKYAFAQVKVWFKDFAVWISNKLHDLFTLGAKAAAALVPFDPTGKAATAARGLAAAAAAQQATTDALTREVDADRAEQSREYQDAMRRVHARTKAHMYEIEAKFAGSAAYTAELEQRIAAIPSQIQASILREADEIAAAGQARAKRAAGETEDGPGASKLPQWLRQLSDGDFSGILSNLTGGIQQQAGEWLRQLDGGDFSGMLSSLTGDIQQQAGDAVSSIMKTLGNIQIPGILQTGPVEGNLTGDIQQQAGDAVSSIMSMLGNIQIPGIPQTGPVERDKIVRALPSSAQEALDALRAADSDDLMQTLSAARDTGGAQLAPLRTVIEEFISKLKDIDFDVNIRQRVEVVPEKMAQALRVVTDDVSATTTGR